jgi:NADH-ubiquinone oxidoreductase chain 5
MYLLVVFIPLFSFLILSLFGRFLGSKESIIFSVGSLVLNIFITFFLFYEIIFCNSSCIIPLFNWIFIDNLHLTWEFRFDSLTAAMLLIINFVSGLVHIYAASYMSEDPHHSRFMSYLSLFTFFMIMLVTSGNFAQLFLGWEGVGLASYLLINFWYTRMQANKSGLKAIIVNRFGDFGLMIAMAAIFETFHSLNFSVIFSLVPFYQYETYNILFFSINKITFICFFLMVGAVGKSAQIGLHIWLPDAMEGPTPVSALIHAATMVTAGVFLLLRCSFLLEYSQTILVSITIIGALTAFFAATTGLLQNDLKRVIAYSTCSQLGYMVFACGLSNYYAGMFHLVNHAFFKALLFLSAGAVIHALNDEQDMRKMGGLFKILPFTYVMILIGSLALMGFPFLTGFYSKDVILELAASKFNFSSGFAYWLGVFSAFFTAFYSFRLINLTFLKKTNSYKSSIENAHDAPILMALPLYLLAFFSIFFGYIFKDLFIGLGTRMWGNSIYINSLNFNMIEAEFLPVSIKLIPLFFSFFGAILSLFLYLICYNVLCKLQKIPVLNKLFVFLNKRWYFDIIYTKFITQPVLNFGYKISFKLIDRGFIELLGPLGLTRFFSNLSFYVNSIQSGYIFEYAAFIVIGVILFLGLLFNFIPFISIAEADLNILFIFSLILSQILI